MHLKSLTSDTSYIAFVVRDTPLVPARKRATTADHSSEEAIGCKKYCEWFDVIISVNTLKNRAQSGGVSGRRLFKNL